MASELPPGGTFLDDDGNIHEADIEAIAAEGITRGCNPTWNDRYCPRDPVTRGQMAAFIRRALDLGGSDEDFFTDDDDSTFEGDINALAEAGITKGCNPPLNNRFCPDDLVTRGQMAAFLVRILGLTDDGDGDLFVDDDHSVFEGDIDRLSTAGIAKGCNPPTNDRFCPDQNLTRAQMASFLTRALELTPLAPPPREILFTADTGINVGFDPWDGSDRPGEFYERWRLWDSSLGCEPDTDLRLCTIDITKDNAEVWVRFPDGTEREVASQLFFYPIRFIPSSPCGVYEFTFELKDGVTHRAMIDFLESQIVALHRTGQTRLENGTTLTGFSLGNIDLRSATSIFHYHPVTGPVSISKADKDFWLALDQLEPGDHTFLAKTGGRWFYAIATYPQDFD